MEEIISAGLEELGLTGRVPEDTPAQLAQYGRMLLEKNQVMNLTAIRRERPGSTCWTAPRSLNSVTSRTKLSSTWAPGQVFREWY